MPIRPLIRFEVFKRDDFTCRYCGRKTPEAVLEIDHVIPVSAGGTDEIENLVTSCAVCNIGKGARMLELRPNDPDVHERAVLLAEQERQLAEYNYWRAQQRAREDRDIAHLRDRWGAMWTGPGRFSWQDSSVRRFLQSLSVADLLDVVEYVSEQPDLRNEDHGWRVFCALCWKRIKDRAPDPRPPPPPRKRPDYDGDA